MLITKKSTFVFVTFVDINVIFFRNCVFVPLLLLELCIFTMKD